jgi:hypothetical protein
MQLCKGCNWVGIMQRRASGLRALYGSLVIVLVV